MSQLTRAIAYDHYGKINVMKVIDLPIQKPKSGELLIKVHAAALNPKDYLVRRGLFWWLSRGGFPKIPGLDFAGVVSEVGPGVDLALGSKVYGSINEVNTTRGTLSDFLLINQNECALKPNSLSFEEAASIPLAGQTALQAMQDLFHLKTGESIAILGASGGVGVHAIQIAKAMGAHVTTTSSASNLEFCRSLGADVALDYHKDDPFAVPNKFDAIFDAYGNKSFSQAARALKPNGMYVNTVPSLKILWDSIRTSFSSKKAKFIVMRSNSEDLNELAAMVETGQLKPVLDSIYDFNEYPEAFKRLESRHARGKIVIRIN